MILTVVIVALCGLAEQAVLLVTVLLAMDALTC
jgi:hypothetical protein